jgi:DNA-binding XRE family transcriptional regulator
MFAPTRRSMRNASAMVEQPHTSFGEVLACKRREAGLRQIDLAEQIGLARSTLANMGLLHGWVTP